MKYQAFSVGDKSYIASLSRWGSESLWDWSKHTAGGRSGIRPESLIAGQGTEDRGEVQEQF